MRAQPQSMSEVGSVTHVVGLLIKHFRGVRPSRITNNAILVGTTFDYWPHTDWPKNAVLFSITNLGTRQNHMGNS